MTNSTIASNSANGGTGIYNHGFDNGQGTVTLKNTILAQGRAGGNLASDTSSGGMGGIVSDGFNLADDGGGGFLVQTTDHLNKDPLLGPLQNNGGATETRALLNGSPAIDKGGAVAGMTTDQRGGMRPVEFSGINNAVGGDGSDIGAFEVQQGTAGEVSISGRVVTAGGRGITNAAITVSGGSLAEPVSVVTGRSGSYTVIGLESGRTYIVSVGSRRFRFTQPSRALSLSDDAVAVDFTADP